MFIPDGYGPGEDRVLVGITVSLDVLKLIAMVGSCISWVWYWVILLGYGYQMVEGRAW